MKLLNKTSYLCLAGFILSTSTADAASYQRYSSDGYINPASLSATENFSATGNLTAFYNSIKFRGTHLNVAGRSNSFTQFYSPTGQMTYRVNPQWVLGFDLSDPLYSNLNFKSGNAAGNKTTIFAKNFSAKASYQLLDNFAVGAGMDVLYIYNSELNIQRANGVVFNKGHSVGLGFDLGFLYKIQPTMQLGGSYYSAIRQKPKGVSRFVNNPNTEVSFNIPAPHTFTLYYTHTFSPEVTSTLTGRYIMWKIFDRLTLSNTAIGLINPVKNFRDGWAASFLTRYQFAEKWAGLGVIGYDSNPNPDATRAIGAPTDAVTTVGLGLQHIPQKGTQYQVTLSTGILKTRLNNLNTVGKVLTLAPRIAFSYSVKY